MIKIEVKINSKFTALKHGTALYGKFKGYKSKFLFTFASEVKRIFLP